MFLTLFFNYKKCELYFFFTAIKNVHKTKNYICVFNLILFNTIMLTKLASYHFNHLCESFSNFAYFRPFLDFLLLSKVPSTVSSDLFPPLESMSAS